MPDDAARIADALERIEAQLTAIRALLEAVVTSPDRGGAVVTVYDIGQREQG